MTETKYSYNYDILCAACNKPRYFGYTDLPDSKMCICKNYPAIPSYDRRLGELPDEALLYASEEDWAFYNKCIEGLPMISDKDGVRLGEDGEPVPYGSGPHNLRWFKQAIEIAQCSRILEIGLNVGYSAAMMLNLLPEEFKSINHVTSIDISDRHETFTAARVLLERYGPHFDFIHSDSKKVFPFIDGRYYDMCFIDGGHEEEDVTNDIQLCKQLKIPYLLLDDIYSRFGPGVLPSIAKFPELELVKDMNNLRLYKVNYDNNTH